LQKEQFLSDFGGTIGLWIGATFITAIEVVDLLMQLIFYRCCVRGRRSPPPNSPQTQSQHHPVKYSQSQFMNQMTAQYGMNGRISPRI
jgi:hypothetical protein